MVRSKKISLLGVGLVVVAGASAVAIAAGTHSTPAPIADAAASSGAASPSAVDAVTLGAYTAWVMETDGGAALGVADTTDSSRTIGSLQNPLILGCEAPATGQVVVLCGGNQDRGRPSLFIGRATPKVTSVEASFPSGRRSSAMVREGIVVIAGPQPASARVYGEAPQTLTARDANGAKIGTYENASATDDLDSQTP